MRRVVVVLVLAALGTACGAPDVIGADVRIMESFPVQINDEVVGSFET